MALELTRAKKPVYPTKTTINLAAVSYTHLDVYKRQVRRRGGGRVLAAELMMVTPAIRNLIREGKTPQIANALATSAAVGSITMDNALIDLYRHSLVDAQTAIDAAHDVDYVTKNTGRF